MHNIGLIVADTNLGDFAVAVIVCLWTYDGWNSLNFVTEELIDPPRNMPRALLISVPLLVVCYICANVAFFAVLPVSDMVDFASGQAVAGLELFHAITEYC